MFVHDPQPIALIEQRPRHDNKWIWRCHVDVSHAAYEVWKFLQPFIVRYDASVFSAPQFAQTLPIPQFLIAPSIDPLADKNRDLDPDAIDDVLHRLGLISDKPMITQIARFDELKDPVGVIKAFKMVNRSLDCQLVLAGDAPNGDPEAEAVLAQARDEADDHPDVHILTLVPGSDIQINALQRAATVLVQKSLREGFGLTVSEALWKGKPVVASAVGGIPLQVKHRFSGLLCHSTEGAALAIKQLLNNPEYARQLGENGREQVRTHNLLTRHVKDYLLLFLSLSHLNEDIVNL